VKAIGPEQLRQNTATPQPSVDLYQIRYLTDEEKAFITAQLKKSQ